jgi:hypothetical protein
VHDGFKVLAYAKLRDSKYIALAVPMAVSKRCRPAFTIAYTTSSDISNSTDHINVSIDEAIEQGALH